MNKKIKYLYVLVSDENDYYLENALLSITSLRMVMPDAFVSLLIDDTTEKTLAGKRRNILNIVNETICPHIAGNWNKKERSRWLKTSARLHINGDFLYIDCDTVVADDLSGVSEMDIELGAVFDAHTTWDDNMPAKYLPGLKERRCWDKMLGFESILKTNRHFNSGVIYCKDTANTRHFYEKWHELWQFSHAISPMDQTPFNQTDYLSGGCITELDGVWNCQIYAEGMLRYLSNARILHCYGGGIREYESFYQLSSSVLFADIKETGCVNKEIQTMLRSTKTAFSPNTLCLYNHKSLYPFLGSITFAFFRRLYNAGMLRWMDIALKPLLWLFKLRHKK